MAVMTLEEKRLRNERLAKTKADKEERARIRYEKVEAKRDINRPGLVFTFICKYKHLRETKYYKTNYWTTAHWQSYTYQNSICVCCGTDSPVYALHNKRYTTAKNGYKQFCKEVYHNCICRRCHHEIVEYLKDNGYDDFKVH